MAALETVFDPCSQRCIQGMVGDFAPRLTSDGYVWEIPAGSCDYSLHDGHLRMGRGRKVGDRLVPGQDPVRLLEMNLERVDDATWPAAGAIFPQ